jgi:hypothetical protein
MNQFTEKIVGVFANDCKAPSSLSLQNILALAFGFFRLPHGVPRTLSEAYQSAKL